MELTENIQIACLPNPAIYNYPTKFGSAVYAIGWGALKYQGSSSDVLYNVKMTLYDGWYDCAQVAINLEKDWDAQLCAGKFIHFDEFAFLMASLLVANRKLDCFKAT